MLEKLTEVLAQHSVLQDKGEAFRAGLAFDLMAVVNRAIGVEPDLQLADLEYQVDSAFFAVFGATLFNLFTLSEYSKRLLYSERTAVVRAMLQTMLLESANYRELVYDREVVDVA